VDDQRLISPWPTPLFDEILLSFTDPCYAGYASELRDVASLAVDTGGMLSTMASLSADDLGPPSPKDTAMEQMQRRRC
jgi:hypothetical protein